MGLIISVKDVMFSLSCVCVSVCLSVCQQDNSNVCITELPIRIVRINAVPILDLRSDLYTDRELLSACDRRSGRIFVVTSKIYAN